MRNVLDRAVTLLLWEHSSQKQSRVVIEKLTFYRYLKYTEECIRGGGCRGTEKNMCEGCSVEKCYEKVKPGGWEMNLEAFCSNS